MKFDTWYLLNREKLAALAALWFLPKKWRDLLSTLLNSLDFLYNQELSVRSLVDEDTRDPIIPVIIIGPDGKPVPVKPPTA